MTEEITSKDNKHFKELKRIIRDGDCLVIEGKKLFDEAIKSAVKIKKVFTDKKNAFLLSDKNYEVFYMENNLLSSCFTTSSKPNSEDLILALADIPHWKTEDLFAKKKDLIFLEEIQDPGNLGMIFRSALAFNAGGIFLSSCSVNPFNTKVVRSSTGAVFKLPCVVLNDLGNFKRLAKEYDYKIVAATTNSQMDSSDINQNDVNVFLFGNEGHGLSKEVLKLAEKIVKIPHTNKVESLNLGVAVSIVLWERYKK